MNAPHPVAARPVSRTAAWIALGLFVVVCATYAEVVDFDFVRYDDPDYVLENPPVRAGLTWAGVRWAFGAWHASNWHPLTWLAHMLDVQMYGLVPAGHHVSAVLLHALATALCFLALRALTARTWESALVAALFGLHPLRVESVAWISERKDVLSGVLFFAMLWAWTRYAREPRPRRLVLAALLFALGLLAKPMLVSVPALLLLLDLWPLERLGTRPLGRLVLEKLPLVALAGLSCLVTLYAQRAGGALSTLESLPLTARLANAPVAVMGYLGHFFWPRGLAYFYPHPALVHPGASPWSLGAGAALAGVLALSVGAFSVRRRLPEVFVGWFWTLGMLVPVLGIVQVGEQALADRYAYLPLVGLQLALVLPLGRLARTHGAARAPLAGLALLALCGCALASVRQARVWRDSESLFAHALAVTRDNYAAEVSLANEQAERGELERARAGYERALAIRSDYAPALYGLGLLEQEHGDPERALELYRAALAALPGLAAAELNLGSLLASQGHTVEAAQAFEHVLELQPGHADAHFDLALLLLVHAQWDDARAHLEAALATRPDFPAAWEKLGLLEQARGERRAAVAAFQRALADPGVIDAPRALAWILATAPEADLHDPERARQLAQRALQASGGDPRALEALAAALAAGGDFVHAQEVQQRALEALPPGAPAAARERFERYRRALAPLPPE